MNDKGAYNAIISSKIFKVLEENGFAIQFINPGPGKYKPKLYTFTKLLN